MTKYWIESICIVILVARVTNFNVIMESDMFENKEGKTVPDVTFHVRSNNEWKNVTTSDLFSGKTVVVFSLPGAFTPTCSSSHLPRYNELAPVFVKNGVDKIVCISVNDSFVMNEWAKDQEVGNIVLIPDGNGEFTEAMGLLVDKSEMGFGRRSWRYSMLVRDGIIEKMFIEPQKPGDPFEVSDADTMLAFLNPEATYPDQVVIFTREGCSYCARAKNLLNEMGYDYAEIPLRNAIRSKVLGALAKSVTVPQVFINGTCIGGLEALENFAVKVA